MRSLFATITKKGVIMKKLLQTVLAISLLFIGVASAATNLTLNKKVKRSEKTAVIVVFDAISLNHPDKSPLFKKNIGQYKLDFTRKVFSKLKIKQVQYLVVGRNVQNVAVVKNRKPKRAYKASLKVIEEVKETASLLDTSKIGKDMSSSIKYVNSLVDEQYKGFDHIITVFYSNMRQTVNVKKLKKIKSIALNPKIEKMMIFANSGLQYTSVKTSQLVNANANVKKFWDLMKILGA
jgi:hypothetical protein